MRPLQPLWECPLFKTCAPPAMPEPGDLWWLVVSVVVWLALLALAGLGRP